ncbi:hypothetical protein IWZ01DRAFT_482891 [Phyllosticta capitalensis]
MPVEQDNAGRLFATLCDQAWKDFRNGDHEGGYTQARQLLSEPRLGEFLEAHCHLLLTSSDYMAVEHGEKAVALYQKFLDNAGPNSPTQYYEDLLTEAKRLLGKAREREAEEEKHLDGEAEVKAIVAAVEEMS